MAENDDSDAHSATQSPPQSSITCVNVEQAPTESRRRQAILRMMSHHASMFRLAKHAWIESMRREMNEVRMELRTAERMLRVATLRKRKCRRKGANTKKNQ
ncbi:uncharacterized protein LOC107017489 [Solanum pennellii]|uniref:Uncharacterized protein LOC107017489 n=1 Tax=Solanum pennellii TaxID=28526 RepID=A0ABM1V827_SOLPN|nr:uncharacterized protein LOC107017489 [Solanum pennellii]